AEVNGVVPRRQIEAEHIQLDHIRRFITLAQQLLTRAAAQGLAREIRLRIIGDGQPGLEQAASIQLLAEDRTETLAKLPDRMAGTLNQHLLGGTRTRGT